MIRQITPYLYYIMETDYRTAQFDLGVSGSYSGVNKTFGSCVRLMPSDGKVQSGKIHNLAVMFSGSSFSGNLDFVFHSSQSTVGNVQSTYTSSFTDLRNIIAVVSLIGTSSLGTDYTTV